MSVRHHNSHWFRVLVRNQHVHTERNCIGRCPSIVLDHTFLARAKRTQNHRSERSSVRYSESLSSCLHGNAQVACLRGRTGWLRIQLYRRDYQLSTCERLSSDTQHHTLVGMSSHLSVFLYMNLCYRAVAQHQRLCMGLGDTLLYRRDVLLHSSVFQTMCSRCCKLGCNSAH